MSKPTSRHIKYYIDDLFIDEKPKELELSAFRFKDGTIVDIGAICYREFKFVQTGKVSTSELGWHTNFNTFDKRRLVFLGALIDALRLNNHSKATTKRKTLLTLMRFISWIGQQDFDVDFNNQSDVKQAYQEYTKWLIHRTKLKDGDALKCTNNTACNIQKAARFACTLMTGCNIKTVEYWATPIRFTDRELFEDTLTSSPVTDEDRFATYAALCDFIHQIWACWVKKEKAAITINGIEIFNHADFYLEYKKDELYNKVCAAAIMSFIGASGANLQVALHASLNDFKYGTTTKNSRMSGLKSRAGGKTVYPEFAAKYLNVWRKWLDIRAQWLGYHNVSSELAFPYLGEGVEPKICTNGILDTSRPAAKLFAHTYGVKWVTARKWRGFKSKLIGSLSGNDIVASADMQGHSIKTALTHYANRSLTDAAQEISSAINAVYDSAIARCRNKPHIPVTIVQASNPDQNTPIGACQSVTELSPVLAEGFTSLAPPPDCSTKENCLFCDKYAAHADETDIRKLLSFSFLLDELAKTMPHAEWVEKWAPYQHRINEILEQMTMVQPEISGIVSRVAEEIQYGELDEFWLDYYETLSQLGVVLA